MRRPTKTFRLVATLLLGAVLALGGCSDPRGGAPATSSPTRIAFVPKIGGIPYFDAMDTGGREAAKQLQPMLAGVQRIRNRLRQQNRADRQPAAQRLSDGHNIGAHAVGLIGP